MNTHEPGTQEPARGAGLVGMRLAARLARREVRRRPGRTLLVALLVAMPVGGMIVADVFVRTNHRTPLEYWRAQYGAADAVVRPGETATGLDTVTALVARGRVLPGQSVADGKLLRTVDQHRSELEVFTLPIADPLTRGIVQVMWRRAPKGGNEIFLTRRAAHELHVGTGGTLRLERPVRHDFTVTGIGEFADGWDRTSIIFPPGEPIPWPNDASVPPVLVDLPANVTRSALEQVRARPNDVGWKLEISPAVIAPAPAEDYAAQDAERQVRWTWVIGALVLTVAGIVIAAAFAVGARRQLVTLGQLAANGAPPKLLRRVLFLQGTWTGIVGALLGIGLGAGALAAIAPYMDRILQRDVHPYTVRLSDLVPIVLLGIGAATIAALLPARTTSRLPVLAALAGRRPLGKVPRWLPISGACVAAGGLALLGLAVVGANGNTPDDYRGHWQLWAITAILGGMAVLLGSCAITPAYVSVLEPATHRAQGSRRLAMRSLARQRTRTGAVVSAISATAALAIAASSLFLGAHAHDTAGTPYMRDDEVMLYGPDLVNGVTAPSAAAVSEAVKVLPNATRTQLLVPVRPNIEWQIRALGRDHPTRDPAEVTFDANGPNGRAYVAIADRALLKEYELSKEDRALLARRGALLLGPGDGLAEIALQGIATPGVAAPPTRTIMAAMVGPREVVSYASGTLPRLLVTPERAAQLGMTPRPGLVVLRNPTRLTRDQRLELSDIAYATETNADGNPNLFVQVDFPQSHVSTLLIQWALVGITLVLVLFVVAVNLALSAAETRDERDVLTVVGAAPATMREANGFKALLLTVMGAVLAVPVGFLPVAVFNLADNKNEPLVFPWFVVSLLVVALPIVAGIVTTVTSGIALRLRPVRISTMAYD